MEDARVRRVASHPRVLMTKLAWGGSVQWKLRLELPELLDAKLEVESWNWNWNWNWNCDT